MKPYLLGFHMTIDGWRPNRDEDGNKIPRSKLAQAGARDPGCLFMGAEVGGGHGTAPRRVKAVPRFRSDVNALRQLTEAKEPPLRRVRCRRASVVVYGFGDASGPGFGSTVGQTDQDDVEFEYGQWITTVRQEKSSNWRELTNCVVTLEGRGQRGLLQGTETFFFTDNDVSDRAYHRGYPTSPELSDLVLRMYKLEMLYDCIIWLIHISGKRMIAQGTDGISRGDRATGSMLGRSILEFVPLHLNPLDRSPALRKWVERVAETLKATIMQPEDWFSMERRANERCIWVVAPAAGDVVREQLGFSRHKRTHGLHIVLIPRIMTGLWRRRMIRTTDAYCHLDNDELWPLDTHFEPLLFFVALPFVVHRPAIEERERLLEKLERCMQRHEMQKEHTRKRSGSHICSRQEVHGVRGQGKPGCYVEQGTATVQNNLREALRADADYAKEFHIGSFTPEMGSFPLEDSIGMKAAILLLRRSLEKGRYEAHVQPDTFRKSQAMLANVTRAGVHGLGDAIGTTERGPMAWLSDAATHTRWFGRFMVGIRRRVGEITKQDEPISIEVLKEVETILEERWNSSQDPHFRMNTALSGAWFMIGFCTGLRGEEMLLVELAGMVDSLEHLEEGRHPIPYFLVPINGRTKLNRDAGAKFWIPCAGVTQSGLQPGKWATRCVSCLVASGRRGGFVFSFHPRMAAKLSDFDEHFYPLLEEVQKATDLIDKSLVVYEVYGIWRSLRRGVTIHAINLELSEKLIRLINRWRDEKGSGKSKRDMLEVYSVLIKHIPTIVKFSVSL